MTAIMQCVDSTLAPAAILEVARREYAVGSAQSCELIQHYLDATYVVSGPDRRFFVRLYNSRFWTLGEVRGELELIQHLAARGVSVAAPVQRRDGGWVTAVQAPEGERLLVVYRYLEGEPLIPSRDAGRFGELVGRMHHALADFVPEHPRRELTWPALIRDSFDVVLVQLREESEQHRYLQDVRASVLARGRELGVESLRTGFCHGDLNFANALRQADGQIGLYDFEVCGRGVLAYDLAVFRWTQRLVGAPEQLWHDFVVGYRSVSELSESELSAMELLVLVRQAYMLGYDARRTAIGSLGTRWRYARRSAKLDALKQLDAELFPGARADAGW